MSVANISRIMIAGTNSGCGKTTITCAILKALMNKGMKVASFKCGPDYIDPMFHSEVLGTHSRNIDLFLCGEKPAKYLFAKNSQEYELSLIEGVMGFYDGLGGNTSENSSYDISEQLKIPVVLVVGCKGASLSVTAIIKGFLDLYPNGIQGVILNHISKAMFPMYKEMIEDNLKIKVLGFMPYEPKAAFESRHLGLITAQELDNLQNKLELLAESALENIDLDAILTLAKNAEPFVYEEVAVKPLSTVNIAVARDKAFCFYYEDSLELLQDLGAKLLPFSPLKDKTLPDDIHGMILGGGYPELYLEQLSNNVTMKESIKKASLAGMPIYAECGGYMYLGNSIMGYPMAEVIDMSCDMTNRLQNFGYITLKKMDKNIPGELVSLFDLQEPVRAHEFHYSVSDNKKHFLLAQKMNGKSWEAGYCRKNVLGLYPHLHFWGNVNTATKFIKGCEDYKNGVSN